MKKTALLLLLLCAIGISAQTRTCSFSMGVQMPKAESKAKLSKVVLYVKPPFERPPECRVTFGYGQFVKVNSGYLELSGYPESRIDFTCEERP